MTILWANNASTTIAGSLTATSTIINLAAGSGAEFPNPTGGDFCMVTLYDQQTQTSNEICKCIARSGDTLTVVRGQENTQARLWNAGDIIANLVTAGSLAALAQGQAQVVDPRNLSFYGVDVGPANTIVVPTTVPPLPNDGLEAGMTFNILVAQSNTLGTAPGGAGSGINASISGLPAVPVLRSGGNIPVAGDMIGTNIYQFIYDGHNLIFQNTGGSQRNIVPQTIFYVSPTGNDTNGTGLDVAHAFATPQGAYNYIINNFTAAVRQVTIQLQPGTYIGGIRFGPSGVNSWKLTGNESNPTTTIIDARSALTYDASARQFVDVPQEEVDRVETNRAAWLSRLEAALEKGIGIEPFVTGSNYGDPVDIGQNCTVEVSGITCRGMNGIGVASSSLAWVHDVQIYVPSVASGACMYGGNGGIMMTWGVMNIIGSGVQAYCLVGMGSQSLMVWGRQSLSGAPVTTPLKVTFSGNPSFVVTAASSDQSQISVVPSYSSFVNGNTVSGKRYIADTLSLINGTGSTTWGPGTVAGTVSNNSIYT